MGDITTVKLSKRTKKELDMLKVHPREPYEDVIKRLITEREKHAKTMSSTRGKLGGIR